MALNITCSDCTKFTAGGGQVQNEDETVGRCNHYGTDALADAFRLNCPGGVKIVQEDQGEMDLAPETVPHIPEAKPFSGKKKKKQGRGLLGRFASSKKKG